MGIGGGREACHDTLLVGTQQFTTVMGMCDARYVHTVSVCQLTLSWILHLSLRIWFNGAKESQQGSGLGLSARFYDAVVLKAY